VFNSGVQPARPESNEDAVQKVHGPVLLINGAERDFLSPASLATFELINSVPVFYGARHDAGHTATVDHPGGGEFANVASNWLLWQFKNDKRAGKCSPVTTATSHKHELGLDATLLRHGSRSLPSTFVPHRNGSAKAADRGRSAPYTPKALRTHSSLTSCRPTRTTQCCS